MRKKRVEKLESLIPLTTVRWYMDTWSGVKRSLHITIDTKLYKAAKANAENLGISLSAYIAALLRADDWAFDDGWIKTKTQRHRDLIAGNGWNTEGREIPHAKHRR